MISKRTLKQTRWSLTSQALLLCALAASPQSANAVQGYGLDQSHCKAIFVVSHDGLAPVTGWFKKISGGVQYDDKNLKNAKVTAYIETNSLDTGSFARDFHLKSEHFFDVKNHPQIIFESTSVKPIAPGHFEVIGKLKIKDISKTVTLDCRGPKGPITDERKQRRLGLTATTKVNRKDFGMVWNREVSPGIFMVGDIVDISLELELVR